MKLAGLHLGDRIYFPGNGPFTVQHVLNLGGVWKAAVTTQDGDTFLLTEADEPLIERIESIESIEVIVVRDHDHLMELMEGSC